jgi:hypothetical protein
MAANSRGDSRRSNLVLVKDAGNNIRHVVELHYLAVNDAVSLEILESEVDQLKAVAFLLELNSLYGAGANVEANQILPAVTFFEHDLFIPRDKERAQSVLLTQTSTGLHCSR